MGATSNYPGSLDTTSQFPADISATAALNSPNHAQMHERYNDAIIEIEEKVGIGDTTPTSGAILIGTGTGQSAWDTTPTFEGTVTVGGVVDITDTTDSSDATGDTGALRCEGGASIAKKLYVGTDLDVDGTTNLDAVDIDGTLTIANGSDGSPSLAFGSDSDLGFFRAAANHMGFNATLDVVTSYTTLRRGTNGGNDNVIGADSSSRRYKENIENFTKSDWENVYNLQAVKFNWKEEINAQRTRDFGLIAEDVADQIPELGVYRIVDSEGDTPVVDSVNYEQLCVYLLEVVKDLNNRLEALEG